MRVAITGTSRAAAVTEAQLEGLRGHLLRLGATVLHHGDCVGADERGHAVARLLGLRVVVHPPSNPKSRAWCRGDETRPERPYLERNRRMVDETELLIALPKSPREELRSGTWATVRYARRLGRTVIILEP